MIESATADLPRAFDDREMYALYQRPHRVADLVLAQWPRFVATVAAGGHLRLLVVSMVAASVVFAVPYGLVLGLHAAWRVTALFLGSLLLCVPALHVFGAYLGQRRSPAQTLAQALSLSTVAALFSLAFAPILWFLAVTNAPGAVIDTPMLSRWLLAVCFLAGVGHLLRCTWGARALGAADLMLVPVWLTLLGFVTLRMAGALGLG